MMTLDVQRVFAVFGGPKGLLDVLLAHQPDNGLNYAAVQMWSQRETIPSRWVIPVLFSAEQAGHDWHEFLTDDLGLYPPRPRPPLKNARPGG